VANGRERVQGLDDGNSLTGVDLAQTGPCLLGFHARLDRLPASQPQGILKQQLTATWCPGRIPDSEAAIPIDGLQLPLVELEIRVRDFSTFRFDGPILKAVVKSASQYRRSSWRSRESTNLRQDVAITGEPCGPRSTDAEHEEHESTLRWAGGAFDPEAFDPAAVKFDDPKKRWKKAFERRP
jgi:hypothetical protein